MQISLGTGVKMDLDKAIESRVLVQANSGGGKSYTLRRFIEQTFGKKQIIIIDPEGEFGNLRSKFDFVYVGKGGDAPAESRSAALLATRLLELKASAIVDLYELPPQDRKHFTRLFCEAMVNAPKELWHDAVVIIDEAHVFAPEKGESEAMGAVIDLATRGRKRGYCVVLATQRLPKLNKDAAAECNNKLIGRASQDIDRKRAAEELGFTTKEQVLSLRDLDPGEFYAFGPAISRDVVRVNIGDVEVKPAKRGVSRAAPPKPSAHVKKILSQLADLPKEAEQEARTVSELKTKIRELESAARTVKPPAPQGPIGVSQWREVGKSLGYWDYFEKQVYELANKETDRVRAEGNAIIKKLQATIDKAAGVLSVHADQVLIERVETAPIVMESRTATIVKPPIVSRDDHMTMPAGELKILKAIAAEPEGISMEHITVLTGYKATSRREYSRKLLAGGYIERRGEDFFITQEGLNSLGDDFVQIPTSGQALRDHVMQTLPEGEKKVLSAIMSWQGPDATREYIESETGYKTTSVREYSRKLAARKLITIEGGRINLSDKLL